LSLLLSRPSFVKTSVIVAGAVALSTILRFLLDPFLGTTSPLIMFFLAVSVCAWYGGFRPGMAATVLGLIVGDFLFHTPRLQVSLFAGRTNTTRTLAFLFVGAAFSIIAEQLRRERQRFQQALHENLARDERLRIMAAVVESTGDFVGIYTPDRKGIFINEAGRKMVGLELDEVSTKDPLEFFHPEDRPLIESVAIPALQRVGRWSGDARFRNLKTGEIIHTMWNAFVVSDEQGHPFAWATISPNLNAYRSIADALRESEERFRFLVDSIPHIVWTAREDGSQDFANRRWYEFTGLPEAEVSADVWRHICHPDDVEHTAKAWYTATQTGEPYNCMHRIRRFDGEYRWILSRALPQRDHQGKVVRWVGTGTDVTDVRDAEHALRAAMTESEQNRAQLEAVFQAVSDGVIVADMDGDLLLINDSEARICGYSDAADMRRNVSDFSEVFELATIDGVVLLPNEWPLLRVLRGETVINQELRVRRRDTGQQWFFSFSGEPVRAHDGKQLLGVLITRDVTESKRAAQALIRTEKLASMGRLAATIAHEINNPLEAVMNSIFIAANSPGLSDQSREYLSLAQEELVRVAHITRQTLGFYRESGAPNEVIMADVVDGVVDIFSRRLSARGIDIHRMYQDVPTVHANSGEIRQVISNIIANAMDSMSEGRGDLYIRIRNTVLRDDAPAVRISIADTGTGIDPAVQGKLFEPFVTTKESFGTGLGLWVSKGIVEKHGGRIKLRSRPGRGTIFSIILPATRSVETAAPQITSKIRLTG
jgi:PAS domain S-box-containing protein